MVQVVPRQDGASLFSLVVLRSCFLVPSFEVLLSKRFTKIYPLQLERALKPLGGKLQRSWNNTMYHLDDLEVCCCLHMAG